MEGSPGNITGIVAVSISVITIIIGAINHRRCKSKCNKRSFEASIDIEQTTPQRIYPAPDSSTIQIRVPEAGEKNPDIK